MQFVVMCSMNYTHIRLFFRPHQDLFYITVKCHQNILNRIQVTERKPNVYRRMDFRLIAISPNLSVGDKNDVLIRFLYICNKGQVTLNIKDKEKENTHFP